MRFLLFVLLALCTLCCTKNVVKIDYNKSSAVNEVRKNVFMKLKQENDLDPCGSGGEMMDQIKMLYCAFNYYHDVEIEEARKLLLIVGDLFVSEVNNNKNIRHYLVNYPFQPQNIQIDIFLKKPDGSELEPEKLHVISLKKGQIEYMNHDLKTNFLITIYKETYEEAMAKISNTSKKDCFSESGYQGLQKIHGKTQMPKKKSKNTL